jgi:hypothetical protein
LGPFTVTAPNPGNNFIVAVGNSAQALYALWIGDPGGRTIKYVHTASPSSPDAGTATVIAIPAANQTSILTTWRTLTVEVYMMNLPGVHMPTYNGLLSQLMAPACVAVQYVANNNSPLPLRDKSGRLWSDVNPQTYVNEFYPTFNSDYHWVVDVIGASVMPSSWVSQGVWVGYNFDGPPWGNLKNGGPAFIFERTAQMQADPSLEPLVFAHEVLHCFFGLHGGLPEADEGIMHVPAIPLLTPRQLKRIQMSGLWY